MGISSQKHYGDIEIKRDDNISSLEGMPKIVVGSFIINKRDISSLEHSPIIVTRNFHCEGNTSLDSLKGSPRIVGESFFCRGLSKSVTSLQGLPDSVGSWVICDKFLEKGDNLYLIANSEINGRLRYLGKGYFENDILDVLEEYFAEEYDNYEND